MKKDLDEQSAELDRQYKAMEQSLKAYVDQRLAASAHETSNAPMHWKAFAVALAVAAIIGAAVFGWMQYGRRAPAPAWEEPQPAASTTHAPSSTQPEDEPEPPAADPHAAVRAAIANGSADGKWAESLKALIETDGAIVAGAMRSAAEVAEPAGRQELQTLAARIDAKQPLTTADRQKARHLLLETVARADIDGNLRDVTPAVVQRLKQQLGVTTRTSDKTSIDLQSEIILRWLEASVR